ncbi:hypothetical protein AgCh_021330 [Apium graveolens]
MTKLITMVVSNPVLDILQAYGLMENPTQCDNHCSYLLMSDTVLPLTGEILSATYDDNKDEDGFVTYSGDL